MLRISGRTKLVFNMLTKLILSMLVGCALMFGMLFISYKPAYGVTFSGEMLGYVSSKKGVQSQIKDFVEKGDSEQVGYVILKEEPEYEFALVKKEMPTSDSDIVARVMSECDVYYRVYGINVDDEEKFVVETVKEAQEITDKINEEQKSYTEKANVEISEKFVQKYELLEDVEVAINNIVSEVKENNKVVKKVTTYSAGSFKTVPEEILLALRESNSEIDFRKPLDTGVLTSRFGMRSLGNHGGLDFGAPIGTPIHVAEDGVVTFVGWYGGYGNLVKVQHASGYETYYGHCSAFGCEVGDEVSKGDVIAYVGNTGRSTGPHVHFEIRIDGVKYDPEVFLPEK